MSWQNGDKQGYLKKFQFYFNVVLHSCRYNFENFMLSLLSALVPSFQAVVFLATCNLPTSVSYQIPVLLLSVYVIMHHLLNSKSFTCPAVCAQIHKFKSCFQFRGSKSKSATVFKTKQLYMRQTKNKYLKTHKLSTCLWQYRRGLRHCLLLIHSLVSVHPGNKDQNHTDCIHNQIKTATWICCFYNYHDWAITFY